MDEREPEKQRGPRDGESGGVGDDEAARAYEALIRPIEHRMVRTIWRITQDPEDAEEAMQEALSVLWRRWDRVCRHPNPQALILRICINAGYDALRRRARRRKSEQLQRPAGEGTAPSPADALALREQESAVFQAIAQLSRNQAAAVIMRLVHGLPYTDIAESLGCRDATARKHVERGRQRLRRLLAPTEYGRPEEAQ